MDSIEYTVFKLIKILNGYGYLYARSMHSDNKLMVKKLFLFWEQKQGINGSINLLIHL